MIQCQNTSAYLQERNVALSCKVSAKPQPSSVYWVIDAKGTALTETEGVVNEYWTLNRVSDPPPPPHLYGYGGLGGGGCLVSG